MSTVTALSAKESLEVIYNSDIEIFDKIPKKLICLLREMASECEKDVILENNVGIINQSISDEAKAILAIIYKDYIANIDEKDRLNEFYIAKQEEIYNTNNLFKREVAQNVKDDQEETALIKVDNKKWYKKIFSFLKNFLKKV